MIRSIIRNPLFNFLIHHFLTEFNCFCVFYLTIDHYVVVMTEGQSAGVEQLFTSDFNQKVQAAEAKINSRSEVISFLKKQKGEQLNCKTSTTIVEQSRDYMVAKVTQQFEGFTKTDLITLVNDGGNWKVSQSINTYK